MQSVKGFNGVEKVSIPRNTLDGVEIQEIDSGLYGNNLYKVCINKLIFVFGRIESSKVYENMSHPDRKVFKHYIPFTISEGGDTTWLRLLFSETETERSFKVLAINTLDGSFKVVKGFKGINTSQFLALTIDIVEMRITEMKNQVIPPRI